jgi:hypothetical protein
MPRIPYFCSIFSHQLVCAWSDEFCDKKGPSHGLSSYCIHQFFVFFIVLGLRLELSIVEYFYCSGALSLRGIELTKG